jgi:hypothetical protein
VDIATRSPSNPAPPPEVIDLRRPEVLDPLIALPGSPTLDQARSALAQASSALYRLWMDTLLDPDTDDETRERLALAARLSRQAQHAVDRDALW